MCSQTTFDCMRFIRGVKVYSLSVLFRRSRPFRYARVNIESSAAVDVANRRSFGLANIMGRLLKASSFNFALIARCPSGRKPVDERWMPAPFALLLRLWMRWLECSSTWTDHYVDRSVHPAIREQEKKRKRENTCQWQFPSRRVRLSLSLCDKREELNCSGWRLRTSEKRYEAKPPKIALLSGDNKRRRPDFQPDLNSSVTHSFATVVNAEASRKNKGNSAFSLASLRHSFFGHTQCRSVGIPF